MVTSHSDTNCLFESFLNTSILSDGAKKEEVAIRGDLILFFFRRKNCKEILERILPTLGDSCSSHETVRV